MRLAAQRDRFEGTAAHEDGAPVRVLVRLLGGALALRGRVRERLDDGPLVQLGHAAQDRGRERVWRRAHAHEHCWLERLERLGQRAHVLHRVRVRQLVVREAAGLRVALGAHEALRVHEPAARSRRRLAHALAARRRHEQVADAGARLAGAQEQQPLLREPRARQAQRGEHAGERDGRRALDVVVERAYALAVLLQDAKGVLVPEVLPLDQRLREAHTHRLHELVHELVVLVAAHARPVDAKVQRVGAQRRVVGADVKHYGQCVVRVEARARRVQRELPDRDAHSKRAEVAEA